MSSKSERITNVASPGMLVSTPSKLLSVSMHKTTASAGSVVLRDGDGDGDIKVTINLSATVTNHEITFPGGINFGSGIYATLTTVTGVTGVYQDL